MEPGVARRPDSASSPWTEPAPWSVVPWSFCILQRFRRGGLARISTCVVVRTGIHAAGAGQYTCRRHIMDADDDIGRHLRGLGGGEPRGSVYTGIKALMIAVLEHGIRDYCGAAGRQCTQAECWVRSNGRGVFSFAVVCETLGLEAAALRLALVRLKNQSALPLRRIRPSVRSGRLTAKSR